MIAVMIFQLAAILLFLAIRALFPEVFVGASKPALAKVAARPRVKSIVTKHTYPVHTQSVRHA